MRTIIQVMGMDSTKFGGLERFMLKLMDFCPEFRFILVYNSMPQSAVYLDELNKRNCLVVVEDCANMKFMDKMRFVRKIVSYKASLIHFHFYSNWFISLMLMFSGVRQYRSVRSCVQTEFYGRLGWLRKLKHKIQWQLCAISIDKFIAVSRYVEGQLKFYGLKNVMTIYHGVEPYYSERLVIDKDKKVVTCLGFANPVKGIDIFIKSLSFVESEDFEAWIIGLDEKQEYTVKMKMLAKELGVKNRIKWIGVVDNVGEYLKISDLFCQTSRSEALSLAACEALMYECPVIGSNVGGLPEVAQLTFENGDSCQLASLIKKVLSDDVYREKLKKEAFEKYSNNFRLETGIKCYYNLYIEALEKIK